MPARRAALTALALVATALPVHADQPRSGLTEFPGRLGLSATSEACEVDHAEQWAGILRHNDHQRLAWLGQATETGGPALDLAAEQTLRTRRDGRWAARVRATTAQSVAPAGQRAPACDVLLSSGTTAEAARDLREPGWAQVLVESRGALTATADVLVDGRLVRTVEPGEGTVLVAVDAGEVVVRLEAGSDLRVEAEDTGKTHETGGTAGLEVALTPYGGAPARQVRVTGGPYLHLPDSLDCAEDRLRVRMTRGERRKLARAVLRVQGRKAVAHRNTRDFSLAVPRGERVHASLFVKQRTGKRAELERRYLPCS